jgi:hypothetical protein
MRKCSFFPGYYLQLGKKINSKHASKITRWQGEALCEIYTTAGAAVGAFTEPETMSSPPTLAQCHRVCISRTANLMLVGLTGNNGVSLDFLPFLYLIHNHSLFSLKRKGL